MMRLSNFFSGTAVRTALSKNGAAPTAEPNGETQTTKITNKANGYRKGGTKMKKIIALLLCVLHRIATTNRWSTQRLTRRTTLQSPAATVCRQSHHNLLPRHSLRYPVLNRIVARVILVDRTRLVFARRIQSARRSRLRLPLTMQVVCHHRHVVHVIADARNPVSILSYPAATASVSNSRVFPVRDASASIAARNSCTNDTKFSLS